MASLNNVQQIETPTPVAVRTKAQFGGRLIPGIAGSNVAWGMDVFLLCHSYVQYQQIHL
jgi:hypothetical protein